MDDIGKASKFSQDLAMVAILLFIAWFMAGCAKQESTPATTPTPKSLSSSWASDSPSWTLDMTADPIAKWTYGSGGACESNVLVAWQADQDQGTLTVSGSVATQTVSGMPACSQFDGTWTYSFLADSTLILCPQAGSCVAMR